MYLGVRAVIAKSIERIHKANLINFAIVPIVFGQSDDYDKIEQNDELEIKGLIEAVKSSDEITVTNKTKGFDFVGKLDLSQRDRDILLAGGLLSYTKQKTV